MSKYKAKLSDMFFSSETPDLFDFLHVVMRFCDDLITTPDLPGDIHELASKIEDCAASLRTAEIEELRKWKASATTQTGIQDSKGQ